MYHKKKSTAFKSLFYLWIMVIILGITNASYAQDEQSSKNRSRQLQQQLDTTRKHYELNAMALTIISPKISARPLNFISGTTNKKQGREIRTSDYFQIGSNTKSFVAATLLKLQSKKILSLNDPITKWLPEYSHWNNVTIRNLLHNNSGLPSYTKSDAFLKIMDDASLDKHFTPAELMHYAYNQPVLFKPGHGWDYSNTNWILAGMVAEKASHQSLNFLFNKFFLSPKALNLSNTKYAPYSYNQVIFERLIHGYNDDGEDVSSRNMSWAASAGAMLASNEDLAYWAYDLFHKNGISTEELAEMQTLVSVENGQEISHNSTSQGGYGLGIGMKMTQAGPNWGHEGHTEGYHSIFAYFPDDDITIAVNASGLKNSDFQDFVTKIVFILRNSQKNT
jgi:D-alanyl-D-alanine carboxypeptidase